MNNLAIGGIYKTPKQPIPSYSANNSVLLDDLTSNGGGALKLPYIQTGASRQEVVEVGTKVRELEISLMDLRA